MQVAVRQQSGKPVLPVSGHAEKVQTAPKIRHSRQIHVIADAEGRSRSPKRGSMARAAAKERASCRCFSRLSLPAD